jgi:tyrosyl-tRNA synthetase
MGQKKSLAWEIVKNLWGEDSAKKAQEHFEKTFQEGKLPDIEKTVPDRTLVDAVANVVQSKSHAKRLLSQKAIEVNGRVVKDPNFQLTGGEIIRVGKKKFVKVE